MGIPLSFHTPWELFPERDLSTAGRQKPLSRLYLDVRGKNQTMVKNWTQADHCEKGGKRKCFETVSF